MYRTTGGRGESQPASSFPGLAALALTACVFVLIGLSAGVPGLGTTAVDDETAARRQSIASTDHPPPASTGGVAAVATGGVGAAYLDAPSSDDQADQPARRADSALDDGLDSELPSVESSPDSTRGPTFAPTGVVATVDGRTATVTWRPPVASNQSQVSHYRVTSTAGRSCVANATTLTCAIHDLADGVVYRFTAAAVWTTGESYSSVPANGVMTGSPLPGPPIGARLKPTAPAGTIEIRWTEPMSSGAGPITGWSITSASGIKYQPAIVAATDQRGIPYFAAHFERSINDPEPLWIAAQNRYGPGPAALVSRDH